MTEPADPFELSRRLGHEFADLALLRLALTHRSYCAETDADEPNERLEFLGDAVLGLAVTDHIHANYPNLVEGELAKLRASVVNTATLAEIARSIGVGEAMLLGRGEDQSGGRDKESILADALEAILGAVYLDAGWDTARRTVLELLVEEITLGAERPGRRDFKTRLQEMAAEYELPPPVYRLTSSGPDHDREFDAVVSIDDRDLGVGTGSSKKRAEQAAAEQAWRTLDAELAGSDHDVPVSGREGN